MQPLFIPPPPFAGFNVGSFTVHIYSLTMITAIALAWFWSGQRIAKRGGDRDQWDTMALWAVVFGIVGARTYHVVTEHARYFGPGRDPWDALKIWNGGLGVIGSIIGGGLAVLVYCLVKRIHFTSIADCVAPTLLAAQAWGRVGNWFNQEAFGKPSSLPWALKVDLAYRPEGYTQYATFHPTFLYEGVWNLIGVAVLILVLERRLHFGRGKLLTSYVLWYTFGRFFIELIRIDPVHEVGGFRINDVTSAIIFVAAAAVLALQVRFAPGSDPYPFGEPVADDDGTDEADMDEVFVEEEPEQPAPKTRHRRHPSAPAVADTSPPDAEPSAPAADAPEESAPAETGDAPAPEEPDVPAEGIPGEGTPAAAAE